MKKKIPVLIILLFPILFTFLFFNRDLGLNLLLFETACILILLYFRKINLKKSVALILFCCLALTSIAFVINYSILALSVNIISFFILIGSVVYSDSRSVITSFLIAITNFTGSIKYFWMRNSQHIFGKEKNIAFLKWIKIIIIPLLIVFVFVLIYQAANPIFQKGLNNFTQNISETISSLFSHFDFNLIFTLILGLLISIFIFTGYVENKISKKDAKASDFIFRERKRRFGIKVPSVKNEIKSGIFLLVVLNALILIINIIDIYWVWFNFSWSGQYLKQFVHEGTYLLILSILISIGIVLFFFRKNINFYSRKKLIVWLSYIWLVQNSILAISVLVRNYWYIEYFNLAYKRIGVVIFLALTLFGIFTVFIKVKKIRSSFYLLRYNSLALIIVLTLVSTVNWDNQIARYNFKHYKTGFIHFDYLSELPDKTLAYLDLSKDQLKEISLIQAEKFPFDQNYMGWESYYHRIEIRKELFINKWKTKDFLSWNLTEQLAYDKLQKRKN